MGRECAVHFEVLTRVQEHRDPGQKSRSRTPNRCRQRKRRWRCVRASHRGLAWPNSHDPVPILWHRLAFRPVARQVESWHSGCAQVMSLTSVTWLFSVEVTPPWPPLLHSFPEQSPNGETHNCRSHRISRPRRLFLRRLSGDHVARSKG